MERLARAQVRKVGGAAEGAVEEIKKIELDTAWGFERTGPQRMEHPDLDRRRLHSQVLN